MRGIAGLLGLAAFVLLVAGRGDAQQAPAAATAPAAPPLLPATTHLVLTLPEPALASVATDDASKRWLLQPLTLTLSPLLAATLTATTPLQTANGELSTYVAFAPLAAVQGVTLNAQGSVAPKLNLDCGTTCQQQVEGSLALEAQVPVAGPTAQPDAAVFVRSEQVSAQPRGERRLRVGVLGAF